MRHGRTHQQFLGGWGGQCACCAGGASLAPGCGVQQPTVHGAGRFSSSKTRCRATPSLQVGACAVYSGALYMQKSVCPLWHLTSRGWAKKKGTLNVHGSTYNSGVSWQVYMEASRERTTARTMLSTTSTIWACWRRRCRGLALTLPAALANLPSASFCSAAWLCLWAQARCVMIWQGTYDRLNSMLSRATSPPLVDALTFLAAIGLPALKSCTQLWERHSRAADVSLPA